MFRLPLQGSESRSSLCYYFFPNGVCTEVVYSVQYPSNIKLGVVGATHLRHEGNVSFDSESPQFVDPGQIQSCTVSRESMEVDV